MIIKLYEKRHTAEADKSYAAKAAQWRAKLAGYQASTQPASRPSDSPAATSPASSDKPGK